MDENDNVMGSDTRHNCHKAGHLHRCVAVYVMDESNKIILQRRSSTKEIEPKLLDHSASGHVPSGESYEVAAIRELEEELGIILPMNEIGSAVQDSKFSNGLIERQLFKIFLCRHEGRVAFDRVEVDSVHRYPINEIRDMIKDRPSSITEGLHATFPVLLDYLKNKAKSTGTCWKSITLAQGRRKGDSCNPFDVKSRS